jgi:hypothetical protein
MAMQYYDLKRNWRRVRPHLSDPQVVDVLVRDFHKFTMGRWGKPFLPGMLPRQFESCDWDIGHRGRQPAFWQYTKHAACHWLVNFSLELAMASEPDRTWRIITNPEHSTVWDGADVLFDFNFQAMGISPAECFETAHRRELRPGEHLAVHFAAHYSADAVLERARRASAAATLH